MTRIEYDYLDWDWDKTRQRYTAQFMWGREVRGTRPMTVECYRELEYDLRKAEALVLQEALDEDGIEYVEVKR